MRVYLVGGAVRDTLLGLPVAERDWVVVGADAEALREQGFVAADRDFPVFLHPQTGEEYALARREVKRGAGYRGFAVETGPSVTLEEDLRRRDLTINAMAQAEDGGLIDPFGGRQDLEERCLRHVSAAFVEDPIRILRVARFAAKLGRFEFRVAHATHRLMRQMVEQGEMQHVTAERLWRELHAASLTERPWRFFEVLHRCGALTPLIAPLAAQMGQATAHAATPDSVPIVALKRLAETVPAAAPRLAALLFSCVTTPQEAEQLADRVRADRVTAQLLKRAVAGRPQCGPAAQGDTDALFELAKLWRGFDPDSDIATLAKICDAQGSGSDIAHRLRIALPAARAVSADALRAHGLAGAALGRQLAAARRAAMRSALRDAGLLT